MMINHVVQAIGANGLYDFPRNARMANTIQSTHVRTEKEINVLRVTVYVARRHPQLEGRGFHRRLAVSME
jgi:hypothetical protein